MIACVACAGDGTLRTLSLAPDGRLAEIQRLALGGQLMPMAVHAGRGRLYVARRSDPLAVLSLSIEPGTGRLRPLGETPLPASMAYLTVDRGGRWLLAASYPGHLVSVSGIGDDGVVRPVHQVLADQPNAHCVRLCADGETALVAALGADELRTFRFDAARGLLAAGEPLPLPAGTGPRHIELHPTRPVAYLLDELHGQVRTFHLAGGMPRQRQCLESVPAGTASPIWAADLRATADGRWLYATERTGSTVTAFGIDGDSGLLKTLGHWPTQLQPRAIALDPSGRFLLAAGQRSHRVGVHAIGLDGRLTALGECDVGAQPSWVEVIALTG